MKSSASFKKLNLEVSKLDSCINTYCEKNKLNYELKSSSESRKDYEITKVGQEPAKLIVHITKDGTTTLQYNQGKNTELGLEVANHIHSTLCESGVAVMNMTIAGIDEAIIDIIKERIEEVKESNNIKIEENVVGKNLILTLCSKTYRDKLKLSYYKSSKRLHIQGRPLSCYNEVAYALTSELDSETLSKILYKKDELDSALTRPEVSKDLIQSKLPNSFSKLPELIVDLLVSSNCVRSASPVLPEYSLLVYAELRSLEGVIKDHLLKNGVIVQPRHVGEMFVLDKMKIATSLSDDYKNKYKGNKTSELLNAYSYYYKRRHSLFHVEQLVSSTPSINTLEGAINICNKVYELIEDIYS